MVWCLCITIASFILQRSRTRTHVRGHPHKQTQTHDCGFLNITKHKVWLGTPGVPASLCIALGMHILMKTEKVHLYLTFGVFQIHSLMVLSKGPNRIYIAIVGIREEQWWVKAPDVFLLRKFTTFHLNIDQSLCSTVQRCWIEVSLPGIDEC